MPLTVAFVNYSSLDHATWQWDFGDGTASSEKCANHTCAKAVNFSVTLNGKSANGADSDTKKDFVKVMPGVESR